MRQGPGNRRGGGAGAYRTWQRLSARAFTALVRGSLRSCGPSSRIQPPLRIAGEHGITIGSGVWVGPNCWLATYATARGPGVLEIGDGTSIAGFCVLAAATHVRVGRSVLFARNVYVADHQHAFTDPDVPILDQGLERVAAIEIGDGAWLGQNVVVGPGVTIGRGAVIGANSVVKSDVPDFCLAVGAPARIVRRFADPKTSPTGATAGHG